MEVIPSNTVLTPWHPGVFSLIVYAAMVAGLMLVLLFLSRWVGYRRWRKEKSRPYESGIIPTGSARLHYPVPFFLVAIFFLLFDLEGAFILSYAVAADALGWSGWLQITFFIAVLIVGLVYIWIKGGLDWRPNLDQN